MSRVGQRGAVLAATIALSIAAPASAAVTPVPPDASGAASLGAAAGGPGLHPGTAAFDAVPAAGVKAHGVGDAPLAGFPASGGTFAVLSTGDVTNAKVVSGSEQGTDLGVTDSPRGFSVFDDSRLKVPVTVPATANCVSLEFRFASQEFSRFSVNQKYNDGFFAELDGSTWQGTTDGKYLDLGNDFARDAAGRPITANPALGTTLTADAATGTFYGGATPLIRADHPITAGSHTLTLSVVDRGDRIFDSAAYVDDVRTGYVPDPEVNCDGDSGQVVTQRLTLTPQDGSHYVGESHTVTATLTDLDGDPIADAPVGFSAAGANDATDSATTDEDGEATFTYTGTSAGDDGIAACSAPDEDGRCEAVASATHTWVANPVITIDDAPVSVVEGDTAKVGVSLSEAATKPVTVDYATGGGTAVAGEDYPVTGGTLTIAKGETTGTIDVPTTDDALDESDETVGLTLSNAHIGALPEGGASTTIGIEDDDTAVPSIGDATVTEGGLGKVPVTLSTLADHPIDVPYATDGGTATAGTDYTAASGTLTVPAMAQGAAVEVQTTQDDVDELAETVGVDLTGAAQARRVDAGPDSATLTITDDDTALVSVADDETTEGETGTLPVTLSGPADRPITLTYAKTGGTASADDTGETSGTVTIAPGDTAVPIAIATKRDGIVEGDETVVVTSTLGDVGAFGRDVATLTIHDADQPPAATPTQAPGGGVLGVSDASPTLSVGDVTVKESAGKATVRISAASAVKSATAVAWSTADGSAKAGKDYEAAKGTATIAAGATSATVTVPIVDDKAHEKTERFLVRTATASGTVTIRDDDAALPACSSRRLIPIRVRPRDVPLTSATVTFRGKPLTVRRIKGRLTAVVDLRKLPLGVYRIKVRSRGANGRTFNDDRVYRTCKKKGS